MTWPRNTYLPTYIPTYLPTYLITHWATFDSRYVAGFFLATGSRIFSCYRYFILNCAMCAHNCNTRQSCKLVTFETLIAILTIEKPEFMKIFVTWQLRVTVDSIRNSCDVLSISNDFFKFHDLLIRGGIIAQGRSWQVVPHPRCRGDQTAILRRSGDWASPPLQKDDHRLENSLIKS